MNNSFSNINYFDVFKNFEVELPSMKGKKVRLLRHHERDFNYKILQQIEIVVNKQRGQRAELLQKLVEQAQTIFNDEQNYQNYLQEIDADKKRIQSLEAQLKKLSEELERQRSRSYSTDNQTVRELEAELRKVQNRLDAEREAAQQKIQELEEILEAQKKPETTSKTGWQIFGEIAGSVAKTLIERAAQQTPTPPNPAASHLDDRSLSPRPSINLTGYWQDTQGVVYWLEHRGNQIAIQAQDPMGRVSVTGRGTVSGSRVQITYQNYFYGSYGQGQLNVSANGWRLDGTIADSLSGSYYATFLRQS